MIDTKFHKFTGIAHLAKIKRRVYGRSFKVEVMKRIEQGEVPARIASDLGVCRSMITRWRSEWQQNSEQAFRGNGRRLSTVSHIERMERQIRRLEIERDLLKKAWVRFATMPKLCSGSLQSIERPTQSSQFAKFSMFRGAGITAG